MKTVTTCILASLAWANVASAQEADLTCNTKVQDALFQEAANGAQMQFGIIRDQDNGILDPESILEMNCLEDVWNPSGLNVHVDPEVIANWLIDFAKKQICTAYNDYFDQRMDEPFDPSVFTRRLPRLPGLTLTTPVAGDEEIPEFSIDVEASETLGTEGASVSSDELLDEVVNGVKDAVPANTRSVLDDILGN